MAILKVNPNIYKKRIIDLNSPDGNAGCLIGTAMTWGRQMDLDIKTLSEEMMSGDYEHLLEVFDRNFGSVCDLVR